MSRQEESFPDFSRYMQPIRRATVKFRMTIPCGSVGMSEEGTFFFSRNDKQHAYNVIEPLFRVRIPQKCMKGAQWNVSRWVYLFYSHKGLKIHSSSSTSTFSQFFVTKEGPVREILLVFTLSVCSHLLSC